LTDVFTWSHGVTDLNDPEVFESVLRSLPTGVCLVDRDRRIRFWNEGAQRLTGYLPQDIVGRLLLDHLFSKPDDPKKPGSEVADPVSLAFRDGKSSVAEVSLLHKDGHGIPVLLRTLPIRNTAGKVVGVVESFDESFAASERTRRQARLADFGCLDEVTGLPLESFMETQLREHLDLFSKHHVLFGVLLIQIDQMEAHRARFGPGVVQDIRRVITNTVEQALRPTDLLGLWTENQFIALLAECNAAGLERAGERIRADVSHSKVEWWGDSISVTCALGGANCREGDTAYLLVGRAERSLQESIRQGGNRVTAVV
jgi:diguanylate cyclase (GGDEF)-like protein/PAS domain S-box-containing protein